MKPLQDRVIVRKIEAEQQSIIFTKQDDSQITGTVIAAGDGHRMENGTIVPLEVAVGDTVIFPSHLAAAIKVDGEDVLILKEADIFAVVDHD